MMFDASGRTVLVTGARRGIGRAIAEAFAESGADIVGVSLSEDHREVAETIESFGRRFTGYSCDFSDRARTTALATTLLERHEIDVFIGNAGTFRRKPALEQSQSDWDHVQEVDLAAPFFLAQSVATGMIARGWGRIIFTASMTSFQGGLNVVGYATAKSGLLGLTRALSNEWAPQGVTVNAIAPGYVDTAVTEALQSDPLRSRQILERIPVGRWGRPADIAGAAVFLASDAAAYVTGATLPVDGGWLAR